jgi:phosphopantothenoylcysteine decarboxylase
MNTLLCITGSVASQLANKLVISFQNIGEVKACATDNAVNHFIGSRPTDKSTRVGLYKDEDEWRLWKKDKRVLHIELKDWADIIVFAPLSANTLAKMASGMCDNLVTSIFRAWPVSKPIVLAPAMNTDMWENPVTAQNINDTSGRYDSLYVVMPIEKTLICGTTGIGAMAEISDIVEMVKRVG